MVHRARYRNRRTWLLEVADISNLQLKIYGICGEGKEIQPSTVINAKSFIKSNVDFAADAKYGFVVLHHGEEAMWLLVDWWVEDILHQQLSYAPVDDVDNFQAGPPNHEMACVWELLVTAHERDAWVKHTMTDPENADFAAYLSDVLLIQ